MRLSLGVAAVVSGASGLAGWLGQVVWETVSDRSGRRPVLGISAVGCGESTLLLKISSQTTGWLLLPFWGLHGWRHGRSPARRC